MKRAAARNRAAGGAAAALVVLALALTLPGCTADRAAAAASKPPEPLTPAIKRRVARNPPLAAVPPDPTNKFADSQPAAELGHRIFFDPRFSSSGAVSCSTCHDPAHGFADARAVAVGVGTGTRQAMTVLNAAHQRWFTWDGRADTMWSQAVQPFEAALEMNFPRDRVVAQVAVDPVLRAAYERAFGVAPPAAGAPAAAIDRAFANIGKALAAYERHLVTGPSAYDRWWTRQAAGDPRADEELSAAARRGLVIFFDEGNCWQCHHGALFSDGEFHMLGLPPLAGGAPHDPGRYSVIDRVRADPFNAAGPHSDDPTGPQARISASLAKDPDLWGRFRTPSLRNVAETPPYMHEGQKATLEDVVRFYASLEGATSLDHHRELVLVRLGLSPAKQADLTAFLHMLTGTPPAAPWNAPPGPAVDRNGAADSR